MISYKKIIIIYLIFLNLLHVLSLTLDQNLIGLIDFLKLLLLTIFMIYLLSFDNPIYTTIIITCIIFIQTRIILLPLIPENFTYDKISLYPENISESINIYIISFIGSVIGVALPYRYLNTNKGKRFYGLVPFDINVRDKILFYKICIILYFATSLLYVIIKLTTGLGIPGFNHVHSEYEGYSLVLFNSFASLGLVSAICYFMNFKNNTNFNFKLGIYWFLFVTVLSFSKAAFIYAILPGAFYFILINKGVDKKFLIYFILMIMGSIVFGGLIMNIRLEIGSWLTGYNYNIDEEFYNSFLLASAKMFLARLGSTFDVLYSINVYINDIIPFIDFITETKIFINSLIPGSVFFIDDYLDLPFLIPHLFHGIPIKSLGGYAENIPLFSYIYIFSNDFYFLGVLIVFSIYTVIFNFLTSLYSRIFLLQFLMLDLSNGGGISDIRSILSFYASFFVCLTIYFLFHLFSNRRYE